MSGIPYFYLMQKKRIQGKGENNKRISSFSEGLLVLLIVYSAQEKGLFAFFLCRFFFSCLEIRILFLSIRQRLEFLLYSGLPLGPLLLRFRVGSAQTEGKEIWRGTNLL
jgi:hypothetical protein